MDVSGTPENRCCYNIAPLFRKKRRVIIKASPRPTACHISATPSAPHRNRRARRPAHVPRHLPGVGAHLPLLQRPQGHLGGGRRREGLPQRGIRLPAGVRRSLHGGGGRGPLATLTTQMDSDIIPHLSGRRPTADRLMVGGWLARSALFRAGRDETSPTPPPPAHGIAGWIFSTTPGPP